MAKLKLGVIVGSNRRESINRKLAQVLIRLGQDKFDCEFIQIDDLPIYGQDYETPVPGPVARLKVDVDATDAILFVTPEHDRAIPALLKNAIDWGTRPYGQNSWRGKPAAVTGTSGGATSTAVAQAQLRGIINSSSAMHVMGGETYIQYKPELIDAAHAVTDGNVRKFLQAFIDQFAEFAGRLAPAAARKAA
jgi:chromate reductase